MLDIKVKALDRLVLSGDNCNTRRRCGNAATSKAKFRISNRMWKHNVSTDDIRDVTNFLVSHEHGNVWVDCQKYNPADVVGICEVAFGGLHPLTLELLGSSSRRESLQELQAYTFCYLGPDYAFILYSNGIISLSRGPNKFRNEIHQLLKHSLPHTREWICYTLLDKMTRSLLPGCKQIDADANWVNEHVYITYDDTEDESVLDCLAETRGRTLKLINQTRNRLEVVEALARRWDNHEIAYHFECMKATLLGTKKRLEAHESLLANTHRNWMAGTQMNLEKVKTRTLVIVGQFLALATVFIPILTIYTAGHMNLDGPGMGEDATGLTNWGIIQASVLGCAALIVILLGWYFRSIMKRPPPPLVKQ